MPTQSTFVAMVLLLASTLSGLAQEPRIGGALRLEAWQHHQEMVAGSPFKDLQWHKLGPKFAGGRIESIDAPFGATVKSPIAKVDSRSKIGSHVSPPLIVFQMPPAPTPA